LSNVIRGATNLQSGVLEHTKIDNPKNNTIINATVETIDGKFYLKANANNSFMIVDDKIVALDMPKDLPDISYLLTKEQYNIIIKNASQPVIIQGQAGSGKTTVALHRASWLTSSYTGHTPIKPENILIIMFNKALSTFIQSSLKELNLESANVSTFHSWVLKAVKNAYNGRIDINTDTIKNEKISKDLKKQIGLLEALDEFIKRQTISLNQWVENKLKSYDAKEWIDQIVNSDQPVVKNLIELRSKALIERNNATGKTKEQLKQIHLLLSKAVQRMTHYKEELLNFLTNKKLLLKYLPQVSTSDIEILCQYQQELQGKEATKRRPGPFVAFEDLALILYLIKQKHGGFPNKNQDDSIKLYEHLVIDEAQDLGALDITVLLSVVQSQSNVTIVGDTNQKIIPDADFMGWDKLSKKLGVEDGKALKLEIAHRSTKSIMDLANSIINESSLSKGELGVKPSFIKVDDSLQKTKKIISILDELMADDPNSHICVVCRHKKNVKPLMEKLNVKNIDANIRTGYNKHFTFVPGVTITNMHQVKGLEFDSVILLDPSEKNYVNDTQGGKYLYTVITRAKKHLYMIGKDAPSSLLDKAIEKKLLDVKEFSSIIPIEFDEDDDKAFYVEDI